MSNVKENENYRKPTWYRSNKFPLLPNVVKRKSDKHNTRSFSFHWLFFKFWILDSFNLELSVVCSGHWGIGVIGILPYLRWAVSIPVPDKLSFWLEKKTNRAYIFKKVYH